MDKDYDAIVMGCGPTGAIASILLANKGFKVAVVEKSAKPYPYPRAIALNEFTMDLLKNLLGELWEKFNFTTAVEVGYVLSKEKINEPFGLMQPPEIEGKILDLDNFFTDIHKYLRLLEQVVIDTLSEHNIRCERSSGETGVWFEPETTSARKICALGVRASRWVTMHGFALNVNPPLSYFDHIIPCGISGKGVTSMENELNKTVSIESVKTQLAKNFKKHFGFEWVN